MTQEEAKKIVELLKSEKTYKQGHYHYGYEYYWYDSSSDLFIRKLEDLAMDIFNPSITETKLTENEFIAKLLESYEYEKMKSNML